MDGEGRLPRPLLALITGLWDSLQSLAEQRIQEHQANTHQETLVLQSQLQIAQQTQTQLRQELHQLQETFDTEQRAKLALATQQQAAETAHDKITALHASVLQQLDDAKQENQRLHKLAAQIQANLEHYQQAIQQQQLEQNLAKEKQQAIYAQELAQLKALLDETNARFNQNEKALATGQLQLQQTQAKHEELVNRYEKIMAKNHETERALIQWEAQANYQQKQTEKNEQDLSAERQLTQSLYQQVTVLTEQLQRAKNDLRQAEDKVETLRQEKLFLSQEKAQLDGALKQLQKAKTVA